MEFTGGSRYGKSFWRSANYTWPLARLEIEPDKLRLSTFFGRTFLFEKSQIKSLSMYGGLFFFSTGLLIEHSVADYPPFIVFWTFSFDGVKTELVRNGYEVS